MHPIFRRARSLLRTARLDFASDRFGELEISSNFLELLVMRILNRRSLD